MTVGELQRLLEGQPKDRQVILSIDEEGNNFKLLSSWNDEYLWSPSLQGLWSPEDEEGDPPQDAYPVFVLWP